MNRNVALVLLMAFMFIGMVGWLGLGGLKLDKFQPPEGAIEFFDIMTKSTFGAMMTVLTQTLLHRRSNRQNI